MLQALKATIPIWLPKYEAMYGRLEEPEREKILAISAATIDRVMYRTRLDNRGRGKTTTKPGGLLRAQIPVQTGQWEETRPGFTVAHCGGSMAGEFVFTLDCVDIATGWSEQRALWNKSAAQVVKQMIDIEGQLPFPLLGFDADTGSEFINEQLVKHFLGRKWQVQFTRSRAYRKERQRPCRRTGPTYGNGSVTTGSNVHRRSSSSTTSTSTSGDCTTTSTGSR